MTDDQIRMIAERMDLEDRVCRLRVDLAQEPTTLKALGIDYPERVRMREQLGAMVAYLEILTERISAFRGEPQ
ncbi:crAss001_48 related protein (plasmid) [Ralstonia syzygii subsp. celebesensis]|uniref:crAss001_48 related protein n=1 Tax=Ralstonia syzygii TaxID=28097 RepID=UPI00387E0E5A